MSTAAERVLEETKRFYKALPGLLPQHRDKWVVFRDNKVQSEHGSRDEAYAAAVEAFGRDGAFVIARVAEVSPTPVNAGALYGIA